MRDDPVTRAEVAAREDRRVRRRDDGAHAKVARALERRRKVSGWAFSVEHPAVWTFSRGRLVAYATPDYEEAGSLQFQVMDVGGQFYPDISDCATYRPPLTVSGYLQFVAPRLRRAWRERGGAA